MMKTRLIFAVMVMMATLGAPAALLYSSGALNALIPDGNINGYQNTMTISGLGSGQNVISDVNVTLNISGGYNGDLYVYLTHASGFSVLLNRTGRTAGDSFGYSDAGFNVTLNDSASTDVHLYGGNSGAQLTGTWQPDARNVDPATVTDGSIRGAYLGTFNGLDPNGTWTLFAADRASGDQSTLVSWGLEITAVPEPTTVGLGIFGGLMVLGKALIWFRRKLRVRTGLKKKVSSLV